MSYLPRQFEIQKQAAARRDYDDGSMCSRLSPSSVNFSSMAQSLKQLCTSFRPASFRTSSSISSNKSLASKSISVQRRSKFHSKRLLSFPTLARLAKQQAFEKTMHILRNETDEDVADWLEDCDSPLHVLMRHKPPVELVNMLCLKLEQINPGCLPEDGVDATGTTALIAAVRVHSEYDVIARLLNGSGSTLPAMTMDSQQRLPLHWACIPAGTAGVKWSFRLPPKSTSNVLCRSVIQLLIKAYPQARHVKDRFGNTPLDLAKKYWDKNSDPLILADLVGSDQSACVNSRAGTAMSTVVWDVPREIFCIGDISHHKKRLQELNDCSSDIDIFETLEI